MQMRMHWCLVKLHDGSLRYNFDYHIVDMGFV